MLGLALSLFLRYAAHCKFALAALSLFLCLSASLPLCLSLSGPATLCWLSLHHRHSGSPLLCHLFHHHQCFRPGFFFPLSPIPPPFSSSFPTLIHRLFLPFGLGFLPLLVIAATLRIVFLLGFRSHLPFFLSSLSPPRHRSLPTFGSLPASSFSALFLLQSSQDILPSQDQRRNKTTRQKKNLLPDCIQPSFIPGLFAPIQLRYCHLPFPCGPGSSPRRPILAPSRLFSTKGFAVNRRASSPKASTFLSISIQSTLSAPPSAHLVAFASNTATFFIFP